MLVIGEESDKYPDGKIPNLESDDDALKYMLEKIQPLIARNPELETSFGTLVTWSTDRGMHDHPTWAEAAWAALANESSVRQQSAQRSTVTGQADRITDDALTHTIGQREGEMARALKFANCGQTAAVILNLLEQQFNQLGAQRMEQESAPAHFVPGNHAKLREPLSRVPGQGKVLFVDCSFQGMHTFLLEVHPDRRRYLLQGYQEVYLASWWQGTDRDGLALTRPVKDTVEKLAVQTAKSLKSIGRANEATRTFEGDLEKYNKAVAALAAARSKYGLGQPITPEAMDEFIDNLVAAFSDGTPECFAAGWLSLPFCPIADESIKIKNIGSSPKIQVCSYELDNPGAGSGSIGATVIPLRVSEHVKIAK